MTSSFLLIWCGERSAMYGVPNLGYLCWRRTHQTMLCEWPPNAVKCPFGHPVQLLHSQIVFFIQPSRNVPHSSSFLSFLSCLTHRFHLGIPLAQPRSVLLYRPVFLRRGCDGIKSDPALREKGRKEIVVPVVGVMNAQHCGDGVAPHEEGFVG